MKRCMAAIAGLLVSFRAVATVPEQAVECDLRLDQDVRNAYETQKAVLRVGLKGLDLAQIGGRPQVNLAIALDRSGSMTEEKLARVKDAAIAALRRLGPDDVFALVVYSDSVQTVIPAQKVKDVEDLVGKIRAVKPSRGNTSLFGGVSIAAHEIRKTSGAQYVRRILLMSDGKANAGPSGTDDLGRLAHSLKKEGVSVTTMGVGDDYNEDLMTILAAKSDGNTYYVRTIDDLPRIFTAELGDVLSVVAKNVKVDINCPPGIVPTGIINRDGKIKGQSISFGMNQLYGGQEKYALVEVLVSQSRATGTVEIAEAVVSYENPNTQETKNLDAGSAKVKFSQNQEEVRNSNDVDVQRDLYGNYAAVAREKAIELADEGKILQAAEELRRNGAMLRWNGTMNNDTSLVEAADQLDAQASQIGAQGITPQQRKAMRAESYQTKQQQFAQ